LLFVVRSLFAASYPLAAAVVAEIFGFGRPTPSVLHSIRIGRHCFHNKKAKQSKAKRWQEHQGKGSFALRCVSRQRSSVPGSRHGCVLGEKEHNNATQCNETSLWHGLHCIALHCIGYILAPRKESSQIRDRGLERVFRECIALSCIAMQCNAMKWNAITVPISFLFFPSLFFPSALPIQAARSAAWGAQTRTGTTRPSPRTTMTTTTTMTTPRRCPGPFPRPRARPGGPSPGPARTQPPPASGRPP